MVDLVRSGQLPLWNPYIVCGWPLLATLQIGFFHPLSLIYYVLPFNLAFNYYTIIHYFLAALFMYWLMRYFTLSRAASVLAAIAFAFSGYLISVANMNTTLAAVVWAPLLFLFYDKYVKARGFSIKYVLVLGCFFALQYLGGEPSVLYMTLLFLSVYALVECQRSLRKLAFNLSGLALPLVLAGGLVAIQLLPFLEVVRHSMRGLKTGYDFIAYKALPPRELVSFIMPFFFGNLIKDGSYCRAILGDQYQVWILSPYLGILPLILALFSWLKIRRRIIFLWGIVILGLILAFGRFTPLFALFYHLLPGISMIRYPVKYLFLVFFPLSVLAGFGFEAVLRAVENNERILRIAGRVLGIAAIALGAVYLGLKINLARVFVLLLSRFETPNQFMVGNLWKILHFDLASLGWLVILLFFAAALFYLSWKKLLTREIFGWLIIAMVVIDLAMANININPPGQYELFAASTPNMRILQKDKSIFRYFAAPPRENEPRPVFRVYNENLYHIKDNLTPNWMVPYQLASLGGRASIEPKDFTQFFWPFLRGKIGLAGPMLGLANVKYVLSFSKLPAPQYSLVRTKQLGDIKAYLYQNTYALPRVFFARSVKIVPDKEQIISWLDRGNRFSYKQVILQEDPGPWRPGSKSDQVKVVKYKANKVVVKTSARGQRLLFLSDTYYPGWKAFIDGKKAGIMRANYMFRAVRVPAGDHEVVFAYRPTSLKLGAAISALTIALLGFFLVKRRQ